VRDAPLFYALGRLRHADDKHNRSIEQSKNQSKQISRLTPTKTPVQSNPAQAAAPGEHNPNALP